MRNISISSQTQPALDWNEHLFDPGPFFLPGQERVDQAYRTDHGALYSGDCITVMHRMRDSIIDTVFCDPPFNLGKKYQNGTNDRRPDDEYVEWCKTWLAECVRILKPGGALFVYNLPKWNILLGAHLAALNMEFRHWIAIEMSVHFPIPGRLYPSHYSLLYYTKGAPKTFRRIRTPIQMCRHCGKEIKDYGGHRGAMSPNGVTLKDVWRDIPPVRHAKFKSRNRSANALSTKLLDRIIEMSTVRDEVVLDPFGGSGTTYAVCEYKHRRWLGIEIDYCEDIIDRLANDHIKPHRNSDFVEYGRQ